MLISTSSAPRNRAPGPEATPGRNSDAASKPTTPPAPHPPNQRPHPPRLPHLHRPHPQPPHPPPLAHRTPLAQPAAVTARLGGRDRLGAAAPAGAQGAAEQHELDAVAEPPQEPRVAGGADHDADEERRDGRAHRQP